MAVSLRTVAALCAVAGCLVYLTSLDCGMCFDDETAIEKNKDLLPSAPWSNLLRNDFWGKPMSSRESHKSYRPLTVATFRLNYMLHELQPLGYHLVNVLLHSAVCYLYVLLCGVVFSEVWPALIAGLLFAVHPIHTEAVAGLVGRAELLCALFFISSFLTYRNTLHKHTHGEGKWVGVSLLLCLCSALSKEQGITVVAVILAYDYLVMQKMDLGSSLSLINSLSHPKFKLPPRLRSMLWRAGLLIGFLALFMAFRLQLMKHSPAFPGTINPAATMLDPPYRQLHWSHLIFLNGWLLLNPTTLSPEYAGNTIPLVTSFFDIRNLTSLVTFILLGLLGFYTITRTSNNSRKRAVVCGFSIMFFSYLPASNLFFPVGFVIAERVLYIPSMGFCMLVAEGAYTMIKNHRTILSHLTKLALSLLLVFHSVKTVVQNRAWLTETDLYISAVRSHPTNGKMWHNLASQYAHAENYSFSEGLMRKCIEVEPHYIVGYSDLGALLARQNKLEQAEKVLKTAIGLIEEGLSGNRYITVARKDIAAYVRLANIIKANSSRLEEAHQLCQSALSRVPDDFKATRQLGDVLLRMKRFSEARTQLEKAIQLNPTEPNSYYLLGLVFLELDDLSRAEANIRRSLALGGGGSSYPAFVVHLAGVLERKGELDEAERLLHQALSQEPGNVDGWYTMGLVSRGKRKKHQAEECFTRVLQLSPSHEGTLLKLSQLKSDRGDKSSAIELLSRAVQVNPNNSEARAELARLNQHQHHH